ncbi:MAG: ArnT family glycosyltransferase [Polyangiales bacterium]
MAGLARPRHHALLYAGTAGLLLLFALGLLHGIAEVWRLGHEGWMGASFAQAARNSLRHGVLGQAWHHLAWAPPAKEAFYTHHPLGVHAHLVLLQALLGEHPAIARCLPVAYSLACAGLLWRIGSCHWGPRAGLLTLAVFISMPLTTVFGRTATHEQGGLFWSLLFVHSYLRSNAHCRPRRAVLVALSLSMACQYDYPAYYLAYFVFCHLLARAAGSAPTEARRLQRGAVALALLTLANLALFFTLVHHIRGLDDLIASFSHRRQHPAQLQTQLRTYLMELFGPVYLALTALWLLGSVHRLWRGQARRRDLWPWFFVAAELVHIRAFPSAANYHAYWLYPLTPAVSLASGAVLDRGCSALETWLSRRRSPSPSGRGIRAAAAVAALPSLLVILAAGALHLQQVLPHLPRYWATGGSPLPNYNAGIEVQRWARHWRKRHPGTPPVFIVDHSVQPGGIQLGYHLDAPFVHTDALLADPAHIIAQTPGAMRALLLFDRHHLDPGRLPQVVARARNLRAEVWDQRFLLLDPAKPGRAAPTASWVSQAHAKPWWWSWLRHAKRGPLSLRAQSRPPSLETWLSPPSAD